VRTSGIDHISVTVSDLDRSLAFYRDLLGIPLLGRGEESGSAVASVTGLTDARFYFADLDLGSGQILELLQYVRPKGIRLKPRVFDSGSGHLALRVDNLDNTLRRLKREGILPRAAPVELRGPEWWRGARCVYVSDPDDVTVELVERSSRR